MSNLQTTIEHTAIRAGLGESPSHNNNRASSIPLMQTLPPTSPRRIESTACVQTPGQPVTGNPCPKGSMITITEIALKEIVQLKERMELPVKGLRVNAIPRSPLRADFLMRFVPAEEPESSTDSIQPFDGINVYIAPDSAPYLEGATIDFVFKLFGSELTVVAPLRKLDTPDGRIAAKVQQVLDDEVNPSLASHGGGAVLIDFKDGIVFLELTGGCQGCSQAGATMKDGIQTSILQSVPEVHEVRDVTKHANGRNPYFQR